MKRILKIIGIVVGIIFLILIIGIIILTLINLRGMNEIENNNEKMNTIMEEIKNDQSSYVFVEVNPYFALELQGNNVQNMWCLNDDCEKIKSKIDIQSKTLSESIEILYQISKDNGFDITNGVTLKSSQNIFENIKELSYVNVESIALEEQKKILESIDATTESFNSSELDKLKTDEDYGYIYECNDDLSECYIKNDLHVSFDSLEAYMKGQLPILYRIRNVLNRFGIETVSAKEMGILEEPFFIIYINGKKFTALDDERYLVEVDCGEYTIKLTEINLMNPGDFYSKLEPFEYSPYTLPDGFTYNVSEPICGEVWCKKHTETINFSCENGLQNMTEQRTQKYYVYTKDESILEEVTKEEWTRFDVLAGPVELLPLCEEKYEAELFYGYINPYSDTYCKYYDNNLSYWQVLEPNLS